MKFKLTEHGKELCEMYITELKAKRKDILDAGIDTAYETELPTVQDIENDINWQDVVEDDYYNGLGVTDHYDSEYPLGLKLGEDFVEV